MNIRNLFLVSMIVCAVSVVCATPKTSLTEQAQDILLEHMAKLYNIVPAKIQKIERVVLLLKKMDFEYMLHEMHIGRSVSDVKASLNKKACTPEYSKKKAEFEILLNNISTVDEGCACRGLSSMAMKYDDLIEKTIMSGTVITKKEIDYLKRVIDRLSSILKAYDSMQAKPNNQKLNLAEQTQKILLECISKLNKLLRPQVRQMVKKVILLRKKLAEHHLNEKRKKLKGQLKHRSYPAWHEIGYNEIEALKKKLQLSADERNVMSALHHCKREYITTNVNWWSSMESIDKAQKLIDQEKLVKNLASVLQAL